MEHFTHIKGYIAHSFFRTNYNAGNNGLILQMNIKGRLVNRCVLRGKNGVEYVKFKNNKWGV